MARRLQVRKADLAAAQAAASAFMEKGLKPSSVDIAPDGRLTFRFGSPLLMDELDRELAEWEPGRG